MITLSICNGRHVLNGVECMHACMNKEKVKFSCYLHIAGENYLPCQRKGRSRNTEIDLAALWLE